MFKIEFVMVALTNVEYVFLSYISIRFLLLL